MEIRSLCLPAPVTQVTLCDLCELCGEKQRLRSKRGGKGNELASAVNLFTTVAGVVEAVEAALMIWLPLTVMPVRLVLVEPLMASVEVVPTYTFLNTVLAELALVLHSVKKVLDEL